MILKCQSCGFTAKVSDKYAGKTVKCPECKTLIKVPLSPDVTAPDITQILPPESPKPPPAQPLPSPPSPTQPLPKLAPKVRARSEQADTEEIATFSLAEFIGRTADKDRGGGPFELESPSLLQINLSGPVWTKMGSMVAYRGDIKFTREGVLQQGVKKLLKKAVSGEGAQLTKAEGQGVLYLADHGKKISILHMDNDSIFINGNDLLAFEDGLSWDIKMMKKITGILAGGLFNVKLVGSGLIAITTHQDPLTFKVTPGHPVVTDPNATVAWSGSLEPALKTDVSLKTFIGRGSGESVQMKFEGDGFVVIQPYEEVYLQSG